jgi:hypothetical protein
MNSFQESKNELEAAIRYAENAISSAQSTIESMQFRQDMAKKEYEERTGREQALEREVAELKLQLEEAKTNMALMTDELEQTKSLEDQLKGQVLTATMPVIPRDVAIAIFREGVQSGVRDAVSELEGQTINICENEYCGDFEVTFARDIHLDDELDLDWMRDKAGQYEESFVVGALKGLCSKSGFECRIHGIDDAD